MHAWHAFLQDENQQQHAAVIHNDTVVHFGNPDAQCTTASTETVLCDLSHLGLLEVQGEDRMSFLQGQLTNDIRLLDGNHAQYTAYCNPKGRMLAFFLAFSHADHIHLQLPKPLVEGITKRLKMFIMRSKVVITDDSERMIKMGISGPEATALLQPLFISLPPDDYALVTHTNGVVLRLPGIHPRYQIFTSFANAPVIWQALAEAATPVGAEAWEWLEIQAGIPTVMPATQEAFVPQMLNLDALNAINYKKGCYTGQEIVARTHYLGKVKRRMQLAYLTSNMAPAIGDEVTDQAQQVVGQIVRVARSAILHNSTQTNSTVLNATDAALSEQGHRYDVLVECRLDNVDTNATVSSAFATLFWQEQPLGIRTLPYTLAT